MTEAFNISEKAYQYALKNKITFQDHFIYVDFTLPSSEKRLFIIKNNEVVFATYVAHGSGSGDVYATQFSNENGTHESSIGVYRAGQIYIGKHGVSRTIDGLEFTNDNARARSIVIHSAPYIGNGQTGRSWGCFAVPTDAIETVLDYSKAGTFLVAYYPDQTWLDNSKFLK